MKRFYSDYRTRFKREPREEEVNNKLSSVAHLTDWVDDPTHGQPVVFTESQVESMLSAVNKNVEPGGVDGFFRFSSRGLTESFKRLIDKHQVVPDE